MSKIKIIGPAYPYRGGIAAFNERMADELQKMGHHVDIETFSIQYPGFLFPGKTQFADWEPPGSLSIKRTISSISPINWIRAGIRIKKQNYDLVIFKFWLPLMGPCFGTIARLIRRNRRTKIISVLDNIVPHEKRAGDRILTKYFVGSQQGFIAMSQSVMDDLETFTTNKPRLYSPHPVYDNYGKPVSRENALANLGYDPDYRYILFFGLIRDYKGLDLLIEAFADKRFRNHKYKILIAGEFYSDPDKTYNLIKRLELTDDIIIHPVFVPDSEVANWFCASDIIAQPYKSATQSGITQIGYHFEKPMLVTDVGGLPEIITHSKSGYVVKPDPGEIADALIDFYSNNREQEFIAGVKEDKKRFSWDKMIETIFSLTNQVDSAT